MNIIFPNMRVQMNYPPVKQNDQINNWLSHVHKCTDTHTHTHKHTQRGSLSIDFHERFAKNTKCSKQVGAWCPQIVHTDSWSWICAQLHCANAFLDFYYHDIYNINMYVYILLIFYRLGKSFNLRTEHGGPLRMLYTEHQQKIRLVWKI